MIIEAAPPAENRLREDARKGNYAYVPEPASFFALLNELNNNTDSEEAALEVNGEASQVDTEGPDTEEVSTTESDTVAAETATTSDENVDGAIDGHPTPVVDEVADTPEVETAPSPPPVTPATPLAGTTLEDGAAELSSVTKPLVTPTVVLTAEEAPSEEPLAETLAEELPSLRLATATDVETETGEAPLDDDGPPRNTFPRTLNAHLAEKALRPAVPDTSTPAPDDKSRRTEVALDDSTVAGDDSIPESAPPTPQSTATELGGVRATTQTPAPRIPLANLPGEIAQQIHLIQQHGSSTLRLRISPENLGEVRLKIERTGNTVRVTMLSKNPQVRDALDGQLPELRDALEKQGFTLDEALVGEDPGDGQDNLPSSWEATGRLGTQSLSDVPPTDSPTHRPPSPRYGESGLNVLA